MNSIVTTWYTTLYSCHLISDNQHYMTDLWRQQINTKIVVFSPIPTRWFLTTPIIFLKGRLFVWCTWMYMFGLNWRAIIQRIDRQFRTKIYIPVSHTNGRSIKNMIGVVVNRLVGIGLKGPYPLGPSIIGQSNKFYLDHPQLSRPAIRIAWRRSPSRAIPTRIGAIIGRL